MLSIFRLTDKFPFWLYFHNSFTLIDLCIWYFLHNLDEIQISEADEDITSVGITKLKPVDDGVTVPEEKVSYFNLKS